MGCDHFGDGRIFFLRLNHVYEFDYRHWSVNQSSYAIEINICHLLNPLFESNGEVLTIDERYEKINAV